MRIIETTDDLGLMIIMLITPNKCEVREQDIDQSKLEFCIEVLEEGDPEFERWFLERVLPNEEETSWNTPAIEVI